MYFVKIIENCDLVFFKIDCLENIYIIKIYNAPPNWYKRFKNLRLVSYKFFTIIPYG